jgi:hypothetical protein
MPFVIMKTHTPAISGAKKSLTSRFKDWAASGPSLSGTRQGPPSCQKALIAIGRPRGPNS